jgi:hypothetical protein
MDALEYFYAGLLCPPPEMLGPCQTAVKRTQVFPKYRKQELNFFMLEVQAGYCFKQSAHRAGLEWVWVRNSLYSDDYKMDYALELSMMAGALIRRGDLPVPDRWDGLYDEYK